MTILANIPNITLPNLTVYKISVKTLSSVYEKNHMIPTTDINVSSFTGGGTGKHVSYVCWYTTYIYNIFIAGMAKICSVEMDSVNYIFL